MADNPLVGIIMGSRSDWDALSHAATTLEGLAIPCEVRVLSAHRTPDALDEWVQTAERRGIEVIIAAAGGAAHLAGVIAARTLLPVLGVPMESQSLKGLDSLLSMVQMPAGIPVGTLAIGKPGAINAALLAAALGKLVSGILADRVSARAGVIFSVTCVGLGILAVLGAPPASDVVYAVSLIFAGNVGQIRVVKHDGGSEGQVGEDEQHAAKPPQTAADEKHRNGRDRANGGKQLHHLFAEV